MLQMELRVQVLPLLYIFLGYCSGEGLLEETSSVPPSPTPHFGTAPPVEDGEPVGPSLGFILGIVTIIVTIFYIIGISFKVFKIFRGEYEPSEPVYLKYK